WGNHHLILGGAVRGGHMYGRFPDLSLQGPDDCGSRGVLIPATSTDQFGATLARWMGVADTDLTSVFSNLTHFGTVQNADLGFMA
ncbi:MAG: DUF1501 domain-containing protein, partial [Verrucomicrobia bacterium]|nr:DUF1501 domain-containing protein [Verrucomicrobiota bacterium]